MRSLKTVVIAVTVLWLFGAIVTGSYWMSQEYALIEKDNGDGTVTYRDGQDTATQTKGEFFADAVKYSILVVLVFPTLPYVIVISLVGAMWLIQRRNVGDAVFIAEIVEPSGPARNGRVEAAAMALIVIGILGLATNLLFMAGASVMRPKSADAERPAGMNDEQFTSYQRGQESAPLFNLLITLAVYPLVILGGIRMRELKSLPSAFVATFLAMLPCSPTILFGLPVGIWSLIVLLNPAVQASFAGGSASPTSATGQLNQLTRFIGRKPVAAAMVVAVLILNGLVLGLVTMGLWQRAPEPLRDGQEFTIDGLAKIPSAAGFTWSKGLEATTADGAKFLSFSAKSQETQTIVSLQVYRKVVNDDANRKHLLKLFHEDVLEVINKRGFTPNVAAEPVTPTPVPDHVSFVITGVAPNGVPIEVRTAVMFRSNTYMYSVISAHKEHCDFLIDYAPKITELNGSTLQPIQRGEDFSLEGIVQVPTAAGFRWVLRDKQRVKGVQTITYRATNPSEPETVMAVTVIQVKATDDAARQRMLKTFYDSEKEIVAKKMGLTIIQESPPATISPLPDRIGFSLTLTKPGANKPAMMHGVIVFKNNTYCFEYFSAADGRSEQLAQLAADLKEINATVLRSPASSVASSPSSVTPLTNAPSIPAPVRATPLTNDASIPVPKPETPLTNDANIRATARARALANARRTRAPVPENALTNDPSIRATQITAHAEQLVRNLVWSSDGMHLYTLTRDGLLQRFTLPDMQESQRTQLEGTYSFLGLSRQGLVVARVDTKQIVNLDVGPLQVRQELKIEGANLGAQDITCAPSSSIVYVYVSQSRLLQAVDLRDGSVYSPSIAGQENGEGQADFHCPRLSPDGTTIFSGVNELSKSKTNGSRIVVEQIGPRISGGGIGAVLSDDLRLVALPDGGGNHNDGFPPVNYGTYVFSTADLRKPVLSISTGAYPRVIAFDHVAKNVYAQNSKTQLIVLTESGDKLKEYKIGNGMVLNFLVHPLGSRLCVLTERMLMWVQLPGSESIPIEPQSDRFAGIAEPVRPQSPAAKRRKLASKNAAASNAPRKAPAADEFRTWTDATGKFKVTAKLLELRENSILLEKQDGSRTEVPMNRLSEADQRIAREITGSRQ